VQAGSGRVIYESGTSGLLPGDRVVTSQIPNPRSGMAIIEADATRPQTAASDGGEDAT
jgi:hypothetical protein